MRHGIKKNIGFGVLTVALLGLGLAACGDDGSASSSGGVGGGSGGTGGTGSSSARGEQYVEALCGKLFECCDADDLAERMGLAVTDYAGCRILYRTFWDGAFEPTLKDGEASGRLGLDPAAFDACMIAMKTQTCAEFSVNGALACDAIFVPKVEKGGACTTDVECKTTKCEVPSGAAEGTCVDEPAPGAEGQPCMVNSECGEGLFCDFLTDACVKKRADGADCSSNDQCLSTCVGEQGGGMGTCGKVCEGGGPGPGPVDAALETLGAKFVIAECDRAFNCCTIDERPEILFLGLDSKFECRSFTGIFFGLALANIHTDVLEGRVEVDAAKLSACMDAYAGLGCAEFAKGAEFECPDAIKGLVADGQPCGQDTHCQSTFCDEQAGSDMGTCAPLPGAGAACTTSCAEGFYCEMATCAAKKPVGAACSASDECAEGRCYAPAMGMETCSLICDGM